MIEVGRWLVGQNDFRAHGERARDRDALPLAAAQLVGAMPFELRKSDELQVVPHTTAALLAAHVHELKQRVLDVLGRGQHGKQVERLEDEPDPASAQSREFVGGFFPTAARRRGRPFRSSACRCSRAGSAVSTCRCPTVQRSP
jgi:hypothetical protein